MSFEERRKKDSKESDRYNLSDEIKLLKLDNLEKLVAI